MGFPPIKGFPAVFFISAYEKYDPILYQGDRSYKSVKDWINRHSSIFLTDEEMTGEEEGEEDMPELPEVMESYQDEKIIGEKEEQEEEGEVDEVIKDELYLLWWQISVFLSS